ncbi:MAG: 2-hydroxyacyl-CoA dehydratase family protein [Proteobacteria bacterium]|nr:2-hydroxyacyl-CoA dehydratase family protein [Pseudomonadota bacterium]
MTGVSIQPFAEALDRHPDRLAALAANGHKVLGYFCTYAPIEMIHAAGFVPMRILGGQTAIQRADSLTPGFICPYMRQALEKALRGEYAFLSGVIQGYTCDVACGLINIWDLNIPKPLYHTLPLPYQDRPSARRFLREALEELRQKLEEIGGRPTDDRLAASQDLYARIRTRALELYELRRQGRLPLSARDFLNVVRAGTVTPPEDYLPMIEALTDQVEQAPPAGTTGTPVLISGSLIDEPRILDLLEAAGGRIVADDLCTGLRAFSPPDGQGADPIDRLMDRHFKRFPCPSRIKSQDRAPILAELARTSGARGAVFFIQKFCTPHLADLPTMIEALKAEGLPGLLVEMEETGFNEGQVRTRLETFMDMIGD